jgi:hypothetical protein
MEQGTLIIMTIDNGSSLAVLAAATADHDLGRVRDGILAEQAGNYVRDRT